MRGKRILVIGGTGSLGHALTHRLLPNNEVWLYSRDESKHWQMQLKFKHALDLKFVIGDIADKHKIEETLTRYDFHTIIMAAALKHIDKCEYETRACARTNFLGTQNVLDVVEARRMNMPSLEAVCFVSTDKACSPVNFYGMMKAASECLMIEKAKHVPMVKFVCVRYGNVLNSRGSIIPLLHSIGSDPNITHYMLTDPRMTRFVMTLEQSVDLIEYGLRDGKSGDIIIPKLVSCKIADMLDIFSKLYNKPVQTGKLRSGEKMLETLINSTQSMRTVTGRDGYKHIRPCYSGVTSAEHKEYDSTINPLSRDELEGFLHSQGLLNNAYNDPEASVRARPLPLVSIHGTSRERYRGADPFPHAVLDGSVDASLALACREEILGIPDSAWDRYSNPFEMKFTLRDKNALPPRCTELFNYLTSPRFVADLSALVGHPLLLDPTKNWWGVHKYRNGDHLDIHSDAGVHPVSGQKKHVTLGLYLSKGWSEENGGHLELWSGSSICNDNPVLHRRIAAILPSFNRLVIFDNTNVAWHGNPIPVRCGPDQTRIFLTLSYLSDQHEPPYDNRRKKAFFIPRPEDPEDPEKRALALARADESRCADVYACSKKT